MRPRPPWGPGGGCSKRPAVRRHHGLHHAVLSAVPTPVHAHDIDKTAIKFGLCAFKGIVGLQCPLQRLHPCPFRRTVQFHDNGGAATIERHALDTQHAWRGRFVSG